ncbi:MAG TPA: GFA family protein [Polyangiaceae bacterium]|jgi:hypothetical protein
MSEQKIKGSCFCGAVEVTVTGKPEAMGYCHCASCRQWAAAPINAFSLWKTGNVSVTRGADKLGMFQKSENSKRQFCNTCGGHVMTTHPQWGLIDVYAAVIPDLKFEPGLHVNYEEKVVTIRDGLLKLRDLPKELGGSGEPVAE